MKALPELAINFSYTRMSQANHLLSSSNLVMPSDLWVPITKDIPLVKADQLAGGIDWQFSRGWNLTVEGYFKKMTNLIEYREGTSYSSSSPDWTSLVCVGDGKSYGAEVMVQKGIGRTTGWISYTWSKSLNQFDRPGQELNGGKEFFAGNDRRHNFNLVVMHTFSKAFDASMSWTYQTGRRGNISTALYYSGYPDEYQAIDPMVGLSGASEIPPYENVANNPTAPSFIQQYQLISGYKERNAFVLPAIHRLDVSANYHLYHKRAQSTLSLSIYNLYNRKNVSSVTYGYSDNRLVLKGLCLLPFMPSLQYTLTF